MASDIRDPEQLAAENEALKRRIDELEREAAALGERAAAAREVEAYYQGLAASPQYLMVRSDTKGHILSVNDLYCETFGRRRKDLIGTSFMPLIHEEDLPATLEALKALEQPPHRGAMQQRALTINGYRWFIWEHWAVRDEAGAVVETHALGRDITDFKTLAEESTRAAVEAARATMQELSTPLIPIAQGVIAMPIVGSIDESRAKGVLEALLKGVGEHRASVAILDITGVKTIDTLAAGALVEAAQAVRLLGAEVVLTGIGPAIAHALVDLNTAFSGIVTRGTLQMGIAYALRERERR